MSLLSSKTVRFSRTALLCDITHRIVIIPHRRFGSTYRSKLPPLKMGHMDCPGTSVRNYHNMLSNDPEERSSHLLHSGSLKSPRALGDEISVSRCRYV